MRWSRVSGVISSGRPRPRRRESSAGAGGLSKARLAGDAVMVRALLRRGDGRDRRPRTPPPRLRRCFGLMSVPQEVVARPRPCSIGHAVDLEPPFALGDGPDAADAHLVARFVAG